MSTTPKIKKAPSSSGASDSIDAAFANVTDAVRSAVSGANLPKPKPNPAPKISDIKPHLAKELKAPKSPDVMYYDAQRGFMAVGYLHKLNTVREAQQLKFTTPKKSLPGNAKIQDLVKIEFERVKLSKGREVSLVFLSNGQADVLLKKDLERYLAVLSSQFKDLNTFPTTVQTALVLMAFSLGGAEILLRAFKNLTQAIQNREWSVAASESSMRSGGSLNGVVKKLFLDAHTAQKKQKPLSPLSRKLTEAESQRLTHPEWLSGLAWWNANEAKYDYSKKIEDLESSFKKKVQAFHKALTDAKATVIISATRRSLTRAKIMRYSWQVAEGKDPNKIPHIPGVNIIWDHGDSEKTISAAKDMIGRKGFNMGHIAVLNSNHITGLAIDMTITWENTLKIKKKNGTVKEITSTPRNGGDNKELHDVGKTYGVIKLVTTKDDDKPHWSYNGK